MFLLCFSLAIRILCLATIVAKCWCVVKSELVTVTNMTNTTQTTSEDEKKTTSIFVYVPGMQAPPTPEERKWTDDDALGQTAFCKTLIINVNA